MLLRKHGVRPMVDVYCGGPICSESNILQSGMSLMILDNLKKSYALSGECTSGAGSPVSFNMSAKELSSIAWITKSVSIVVMMGLCSKFFKNFE